MSTGLPRDAIKEKSLTGSGAGRDSAPMTRVTGKFQITLPKRLVGAFGIRVGDEVELVAAGDAIRIVPASAVRSGLSLDERTALRGAALYKMTWFDALIWAYADEHGLDPLWSEDFQDGRYYGRVKVQNPFRMAVHDNPIV
jgi:AbrB family looped-hinge helix DNA binding protein